MDTSPSQPFVEHINATVQDIDGATLFITTAIPEWRVRGGGTLDWYGKTIRWLHVGSDAHYIALQGGGHANASGALLPKSVRNIPEAVDYLKQVLNPRAETPSNLNSLDALFAAIEKK